METLQENNLDRSLTGRVDSYRIDANRKIDTKSRSLLGQFMTPAPIANFMASLFENVKDRVSLLDPGAGIGSLTSAFIQYTCGLDVKPKEIHVNVFEIEKALFEYLYTTLQDCERFCIDAGIQFTSNVIKEDFIKKSVELLLNSEGLFAEKIPLFTHCIMNPPYKKIKSNSSHRFLLSQIGIETSNLYSAFLAIAIKLLSVGGELVAIVPRSFCNGVYFKPFRNLLLKEMALKRVHVFSTRNKAFKDDDVLQENIIFYAVKGINQGHVTITSSTDATFEDMTIREVDFNKVVINTDSDQFIHLAVSDIDQMVVDRMKVFNQSLSALGIDVSTGPLVDFRLRSDIQAHPVIDSYPLIYPCHFNNGYVMWPKLNNKKPNAILETENSNKWLIPNGWYVLTRRFSSKEEHHRIIAAIHDPTKVPGKKIGFENHLNVFHKNKDARMASIQPLLKDLQSISIPR